MTLVKEPVAAASTIEETIAPEVVASAKAKEAALAIENFITATVKNANTFRTKRETTYENVKAAVIVKLDEMRASGEITNYSQLLEQSGAKKMGIYIVGKIELNINGETVEVAVKSKMNTWNLSGETFKAVVVETLTTEEVAA
jgi:hypothetical protein